MDVAYRVLSEETFPPHRGLVPALEVYAADAGGTWQLTVIEENGGPRLRVQADAAAIAALTAAPAVSSALAQARTLAALRTALDAAGAADETRRPTALVVTIDEVAAWCGVAHSTARTWRGMHRFPQPLPAATGDLTWWWPGIRDFLAGNASALSGDIPLLAVPIPPPPPGRRGRKPGLWVRTEFDMQLIRFMHARRDQHGRPVFTRAQIAASLLHPLPPSAISKHLPRGRGGDPNTLPDPKIARMRELRALLGDNGKPVHSLHDLAERFGVSDITVSRYCRDLEMSPQSDRLPGITIATADGGILTPEQVRQVLIMWARRNGDGARQHTREQVAEHFGITPQDVTAIYRLRHLRRAVPLQGAAGRPEDKTRRLPVSLDFPDAAATSPRPGKENAAHSRPRREAGPRKRQGRGRSGLGPQVTHREHPPGQPRSPLSAGNMRIMSNRILAITSRDGRPWPAANGYLPPYGDHAIMVKPVRCARALRSRPRQRSTPDPTITGRPPHDHSPWPRPAGRPIWHHAHLSASSPVVVRRRHRPGGLARLR